MASKRRLRRKACEGKHQYATLADAIQAARRRSAISGQWIIGYRCQWGHHFHIGHPSRKSRLSRERINELSKI